MWGWRCDGVVGPFLPGGACSDGDLDPTNPDGAAKRNKATRGGLSRSPERCFAKVKLGGQGLVHRPPAGALLRGGIACRVGAEAQEGRAGRTEAPCSRPHVCPVRIPARETGQTPGATRWAQEPPLASRLYSRIFLLFTHFCSFCYY